MFLLQEKVNNIHMKSAFINRKGYVLINILIITLILSLAISYLGSSLSNHLYILKEEKYYNELAVLEHQVIKVIKEAYRNEEFDNNRLYIKQSTVQITYLDNYAYIKVNGKYQFRSYLIYEEDCDCIIAYEYR